MTRVLGIDPGLRLTGYGCIGGSTVRPKLIEAGVIRVARGGSRPVGDRLVELEVDLIGVFERTSPTHVAVERVFVHPKRMSTGLIMAHARGVILLVATRLGLPLIELEPATVKKAVTGSGQASKGQMGLSIAAVFGLAEPPSPPDVADALGIALSALPRVEGLGS